MLLIGLQTGILVHDESFACLHAAVDFGRRHSGDFALLLPRFPGGRAGATTVCGDPYAHRIANLHLDRFTIPHGALDAFRDAQQHAVSHSHSDPDSHLYLCSLPYSHALADRYPSPDRHTPSYNYSFSDRNAFSDADSLPYQYAVPFANCFRNTDSFSHFHPLKGPLYAQGRKRPLTQGG